MKLLKSTFPTWCFGILTLLLFPVHQLLSNPVDTLTFDRVLIELNAQTDAVTTAFRVKRDKLQARIKATDRLIAHSKGMRKKRYCQVLEEKLHLLDEMALLDAQFDMTLIKIRYRNGIDLIRLMYEKILGLDHHFTGLHTYQHISILSNPHTYPGFEQAQEEMGKNKNKKYNMQLPALLETNPFISATFTLVSVLLGENNRSQKEKEMEKIACILDFTLRMHADLGTIRNETVFLKQSNQSLKAACERLFQDYTKPVGYIVPLEDCRTHDDWEKLFRNLEDLILEIEVELESEGGVSLATSRHLVNLEFATQRVIDFIGQYVNFIAQGTQYYHKFDNIVNTYQNEAACQEELPRQFSEMKKDIQSTIDKFNNTYDLPELQGSRLKDLMFGVGE